MKKYLINKITLPIIALVFILVLVIICIFTSPAYKTIHSLKEGNYTEAAIQFSRVNNPFQQKIYSLFISSTLEDVNNDFNVDKISLQNAKMIYETIQTFENPVDTSKYYDDFKSLMLSKQNYSDAKEAFDKLDYATAINFYEEVIVADALYDTAQKELNIAIVQFESEVSQSFYESLLSGKEDEALRIINEAMNVIDSSSFSKKKTMITSGIYDKILIMLDKTDDWEKIKQSHAGENIYCCYRITLAKNRSSVFQCYYVIESLNYLPQSGMSVSISGPVAWYRLSGNEINKLSYNEEKQLESGVSISWDYTSTKIEKLQKLESLFS